MKKKKLILTALCTAVAGVVLTLGLNISSLQAADGKTIMEERCTKCHGTGRIERADHDRDGWERTVKRMMGKSHFGPKLSDDEQAALLDYLTQ